MRWPLTYLTLPFLAVHCSAPPHSATFEESGANSTATISATATTNGSGGSAVTTGAGADSGEGATLTANNSSSTSQGGMGGSAGAPAGSGIGGDGAGGDTNTTAATGGSGTSGSVGGNGGNGATGGSAATGGNGGTGASGGSGGTGGASCTPAEEVCDGADNDCNESADEDDVCPEGCVGASFEGHSYLFCDRPRVTGGNNEPARSWQQAMQYCSNRDLNLTLIESEDENSFIYKTLLSLELGGDVWMGATDQEDEGVWTWAAGEEPDDWIPFYDEDEAEPIDDAFNDWREGEPNDDGGEDCGIFEDLGSDEWAWDDRSCQTQFDGFVCESLD